MCFLYVTWCFFFLFLLSPHHILIGLLSDTVAQRVDSFGSGLINLVGLKTKSENILGAYLQNCTEGIIAELAAHHYSLVSLHIAPAPHDVSSTSHLSHILSSTELPVIVVSRAT